MAEPDELYTLRNRFWLGNFSMAIAEGNQLSRLSDVLAVERDEFVYRSYIGLGQYGLVISEVDEESAMPLQAVKLLAQYLEDPASTKDMVIMTLGEWLGDAASKDHPTVQLVAALVYEKEDLMKEAFTAIRHGQTMEQLALWAQFCLKIHRLDLAQAHLKKLSDADEDATLTQLVGAWINLHKGGDNTKEAAYTYEELIDKFGSSLTLLNGLAVAKMHQKDYDEAQKRLQEVRGRVGNPEVALRDLRYGTTVAPMAWRLYAIEQTQLCEYRRVDGAGARRRRADAVTCDSPAGPRQEVRRRRRLDQFDHVQRAHGQGRQGDQPLPAAALRRAPEPPLRRQHEGEGGGVR